MPSWSRGTPARSGNSAGDQPIAGQVRRAAAGSPAPSVDGERRGSRPSRTYCRSSGSWGRRLRTAATSSRTAADHRAVGPHHDIAGLAAPPSRPGCPASRGRSVAPPPVRSASSALHSTPSQPWVTLPLDPRVELVLDVAHDRDRDGEAVGPGWSRGRVRMPDEVPVGVDQRAARHVGRRP